jgi:pyruvate,orthophosphate dikinase
MIGNNYVSCSPFRVPIARLAAAHSALKHRPNGGKTVAAKKKVAAKPQAKKTTKTKAAKR